VSRRLVLALLVLALLAVPASAQAAPGALNVLVTGNCGDQDSLAAAIAAQPGVSSATSFATDTGTPTAAELAGNDVVVSVGDSCDGYADATLWGDRLADYVDAGGAVLQTAYDNWDDPTAHPLGRFASAGYPPLLLGPNDNLDVTLGERIVPSSPILQGVPSFQSTSNTTTPLAPGATLLARWSDGRNAIAIKGGVVATSASPGNATALPGLATIAVNTGNYIHDYALGVTKSGSGTGTVTSSPSGISCGSTCSASFHFGTQVTLTATPGSDSSFAGWSGGCSGTGPCVTTLAGADVAVGATFVATPPAPTAPAAASFAGSKGTIRVDRKGRFRFSFNATAGLAGKAVLRSVGKVRGSRKARVTLARRSFTVPANGRVTLKLRLSKKNFRILTLNRKIRTRMTVKLTNAAGLSSTAGKKITLKAPKLRRQ
jgi:Divergent InlB B-repeat domain